MAKYLDLDGLTRYNNKVNTKLDTKANVDGAYELMTVGNAEQLIASTTVEDKSPYLFRTSGGSLDIGDRLNLKSIVGGTVAFNQSWENSDATASKDPQSTVMSYDSTSDVTTASVTMPSRGWAYVGKRMDIKQNHIYLVSFYVTGTNITNVWYKPDNAALTPGTTYSGAGYYALIQKSERTSQNTTCLVGFSAPNGTEVTVSFSKANAFDLTQMFGSTIADYIYSLEQATAGRGVAYFRSLFPKDYYAYNAGQLMSVKALSHKTVGFNAFNVTTGKAKLLGGNQYQITGTYTALSYSTGETLTPDSNGKFTPSASGELTVTGGDNTTCVHLVWDGERDGEYEAYSEHIYPLDSDLELRGIPKLDANNNLYYDGDTYESDGTVTREYGEVNLGTLTTSDIFYDSEKQLFRTYEFVDLIKRPSSLSVSANAICSAYDIVAYSSIDNMKMGVGTNGIVYWKNTSISTVEAMVTALSGVVLQYELATPTTETADTFQNLQIVDDFGTEEFVDNRDVPIPVGHLTDYYPDLRAKLEMTPNSPDGNGDYLVRQTNGINEYVEYVSPIPTPPTTDGTYVLKATVSSGVATLSWVEE